MYLLTYFWLHWVFVAMFGLSLVVASRGYSLLGVLGLLTAVASLVAEHRLGHVSFSSCSVQAQ